MGSPAGTLPSIGTLTTGERDLIEDTVTPVDFLKRLSVYEGKPETMLMCAVLADALKCFCKGSNRVQQAADEAWMWLEDDESTFSFRNVCETLGFEASRVRQAILEMRNGYVGKQRRFRLRPNAGRRKSLSKKRYRELQRKCA